MRTDTFRLKLDIELDKYFFNLELEQQAPIKKRRRHQTQRMLSGVRAQELDQQYNDEMFHDEPQMFFALIRYEISRANINAA